MKQSIMPTLVVFTLLLAGCTAQPAGYTLKVVPPIQITEAERFRDGGSLRLQFVDQSNKPVIVHMDYRYGGPRQGEVLWVPRGTNTARKLVPGGDEERDLIAVLRTWLDEHVPPGSRDALAQLEKPPAGPEKDFVNWLVLRMVRTLEVRSGKTY